MLATAVCWGRLAVLALLHSKFKLSQCLCVGWWSGVWSRVDFFLFFHKKLNETFCSQRRQEPVAAGLAC